MLVSRDLAAITHAEHDPRLLLHGDHVTTDGTFPQGWSLRHYVTDEMPSDLEIWYKVGCDSSRFIALATQCHFTTSF